MFLNPFARFILSLFAITVFIIYLTEYKTWIGSFTEPIRLYKLRKRLERDERRSD